MINGTIRDLMILMETRAKKRNEPDRLCHNYFTHLKTVAILNKIDNYPNKMLLKMQRRNQTIY